MSNIPEESAAAGVGEEHLDKNGEICNRRPGIFCSFRNIRNRINKSNRTTMRPLGIYLIGISIYVLNMIHFLMISGDFGGFF